MNCKQNTLLSRSFLAWSPLRLPCHCASGVLSPPLGINHRITEVGKTLRIIPCYCMGMGEQLKAILPTNSKLLVTLLKTVCISQWMRLRQLYSDLVDRHIFYDSLWCRWYILHVVPEQKSKLQADLCRFFFPLKQQLMKLVINVTLLGTKSR